MNDKSKIFGGLAIFIAILLFPFWYNLISGAEPFPKLERPLKGERCVEATDFMRAKHMKLLDEWRDLVVREGFRQYVAADGSRYEMSLTKTCLGCHRKEKFCDKCHDYSAVAPYCWDCHADPEKIRENG